MTVEVGAVRGVINIYGARVPGRAAGIIKTEGAKNELTIDLTGALLDDLLILPLVVPDGSSFTGVAKLHVTEAFDLDASSVVEIGESGLEATNGISLTEANLESTGVVNVETGLAGEWDTDALVVGDHTVEIVFSAGAVADPLVGRATLILEYIHTA